MQITVKFVNPSKEGKKYGSIVATDDMRYPCPSEMVGRFQKGKTYEITVERAEWGGNEVQVIRQVKTVGGDAPASGGSQDKWWMPFVSNTVAHAIAAGHIKGPGEIMTWAKAAKLAAEACAAVQKDPKSFDDMDDDIPL